MKKSIILPQEIVWYYNFNLLGETPEMKHPSHYESILGVKIRDKWPEHNRNFVEYKILMEVYNKLYEWKKAKEAYNKAETKEIEKKPVVPFGEINRIRGALGKILRASFKF